jgi:hypothetical protein
VGASLVCPHCGEHDARFVNRRGKWCQSLLGPIQLTRCYYHCRACGRGQVPWDDELQLGSSSLSPAASEVASIAGLQTSFAQAAEVTLKKLCGLRLSESTVERTTEAAGERLDKLHADKVKLGPTRAWTWQRDARGRRCAYVSLDATGIRQQGPRGARAEGRMATVGMLYNPRSEYDEVKPEPRQVRYLAGFYDLDELGGQLRRQAAQIGWDEAEQQIALSDGGNGLEEFFRKHFPRAECILDFWHASDHLTQLGLALDPDDEIRRQARVKDWCHRLKHEGGAAVLGLLEELERDESLSRGARQCLSDQLRYFRNNKHRMDYPRYVANGWQIGSGPVESACKTVVGNRLKGGGMRWGSDGSNAVCHLRALFLSQPGGWENFWKNYPN